MTSPNRMKQAFSIVMDIKINDQLNELISMIISSAAESCTQSHLNFWGPPHLSLVVGSSSRSKQTVIHSSVQLRLCKALLFSSLTPSLLDIQLPERAGIPHPYPLPLLQSYMCSSGSRAMPALPAHKADNLPPALHHFPGLLLLLTHSCYKSIAQCH